MTCSTLVESMKISQRGYLLEKQGFGRQGRIKGVPGGRDRGGWRGWNVECHTMAVTGAEPRGAKTQMFAPPGPGAFEKLNEETGSVNEDKRQPWSDTEDLAA